MTRRELHDYTHAKFLTEIDGDKKKIKAFSEVTITRHDGEGFCCIQDKNGNRDTIDYAYLERF